MSTFREEFAKPIPRVARPGVVTDVSLTEPTCTVLMRGALVVADLVDHTLGVVEAGTIVTLLPIGDTYQVVCTKNGVAGGGAETLGPELLPNPEFEYGGTDLPTSWSSWPWNSGDVTVVRDATAGESLAGSGLVLMTLRPGDVAPFARLWTTAAVRVDPGVAYQASVWVKADAVEATLEHTVSLLTAPTAAGAQLYGDDVTTTTVGVVAGIGSAYQVVSNPVTIPAGHNYARFFLRSTQDAAAAVRVVSWDSASLRQRITS